MHVQRTARPRMPTTLCSSMPFDSSRCRTQRNDTVDARTSREHRIKTNYPGGESPGGGRLRQCHPCHPALRVSPVKAARPVTAGRPAAGSADCGIAAGTKSLARRASSALASQSQQEYYERQSHLLRGVLALRTLSKNSPRGNGFLALGSRSKAPDIHRMN